MKPFLVNIASIQWFRAAQEILVEINRKAYLSFSCERIEADMIMMMIVTVPMEPIIRALTQG